MDFNHFYGLYEKVINNINLQFKKCRQKLKGIYN